MRGGKIFTRRALPAIFILFFMTAGIYAAGEVQKSSPPEDGQVPLSGEFEDSEDPFAERGAKFKFAGQYKDLLTFQQIDNYMGTNIFASETKNLIANMKRIRLSPEFRYSDILLIHVDYDNELMLSSYNKSYEFQAYWRGSQYNDFFDLSWEPYYSEDIYYRTKIHRAYAKINVWHFTFTLGRQQIRFGSGKLWNPMDILNPVSPTFVEGPEDQKGTDAFRMDYYIDDVTELTLVSNQKLYNNRYDDMSIADSNTVLRFKITFYETDLAIIGGWISRRAVAGLDVNTTALVGTLRGSVIYSYPEKDGRWYFQGTLGYEYTFSNSLYILVEYFYNQNGINFNNDLKNAYYDSLIHGIRQSNYLQLSNQFLTMNQHYAGLALGYDLTPLLRGEFFTIYDFQGYGLFLTPSLKYNIKENLDIFGGIMFGFVFDAAPESSDFEAFDEPFMYYIGMNLFF